MEVRVSHGLGTAEATRRLRDAAREMDVRIEEDAGEGATTGTLIKESPLGAVRARWEVQEEAVAVRIEKKPAFLPESTIRRLLEEGLEKVLKSD